MKNIRCIAIDDEPMALVIIEQFCKRRGGIDLSVYSEPNVGLKAIRDEKPDLVFLDIQMNNIDGIEIAGMIPGELPFIFTSAHAQYALEGFNLNAVDFLHKSFSYDRFLKAVDKALFRISFTAALPETIVVKEEYNNITINTNDIVYIEAVGNYIKIFRVGERNILSRMKMKEIESLLPSSVFIRVHRSFIVSLNRIDRFNKNSIILKGFARPIPIGKSYLQDFESRI